MWKRQYRATFYGRGLVGRRRLSETWHVQWGGGIHRGDFGVPVINSSLMFGTHQVTRSARTKAWLHPQDQVGGFEECYWPRHAANGHNSILPAHRCAVTG